MKKESLFKILSPFFLILLWYSVAAIIRAPLILPFPHTVLFRLISLAKTSLFWKAFAFTILRVIIAFLFSFIIGFFSGLLCADYPSFKAFIAFPLNIIRVTPIIAFILLALFWFKSGTVPVVTAVLMSLPVMISTAEKGFTKNRENQEKLFKASCYGFTGFKAFRYIRLPAALPSLMAGAESAFGLCWKVVAAGEVLSIPRYAAGSLMQQAQVHLESADLLALTFALVIVSYLLQNVYRKIIKHML